MKQRNVVSDPPAAAEGVSGDSALAASSHAINGDVRAHNRGRAPYERNFQEIQFAHDVATGVVRNQTPKSVVCIGKSTTLVHELLVNRGVDAQLLESTTELVYQHYDVVILPQSVVRYSTTSREQAVEAVCCRTDTVFLVSPPVAAEMATDIGSWPLENWSELFARHGFLADVERDLWGTEYWIRELHKLDKELPLVIADYERIIGEARRQARAERKRWLQQHRELERLAGTDGENRQLHKKLQIFERQRDAAEKRYESDIPGVLALRDGAAFRLAVKIRHIALRIAPPGSRRSAAYRRVFRRLRSLARWRVRLAFSGILRRRAPPQHVTTQQVPPLLIVDISPAAHEEYQHWRNRHEPIPGQLLEMERANQAWKFRPRVSIVMPVYNPDERYLTEAIESVLRQNYDNWELCIADDASPGEGVRSLLHHFATRDTRIRVVYREDTAGIAAASNSAWSLATGDYIAFLDHDDALRPHALHEVVNFLRDHPECGVVYSDEDKLLPSGEFSEAMFKPDWSPELLLSANYICHFLVVKQAVMRKIGGFREGYDGAQDHDLVLRATEQSDHVGHIAKVLYGWRKLDTSIALTHAAKPDAYIAGRLCIEDAVRRRDADAQVEPGRTLGWVNVRYRMHDNPAVIMVVVMTDESGALLRRCLDGIARTAAYPNYKVHIIGTSQPSMELADWINDSHHVFDLAAEGLWNTVNEVMKRSESDHILILHDAVEPVTSGWLRAMLEQSQRSEVGVVGCRMVKEDKTVLHEGIGLGMGAIAKNVVLGWVGAREVSAVSAAALMTRRNVYEEVDGFDKGFHMGLTDADYCLRVRARGYKVMYTPISELHYHAPRMLCELWSPGDERHFVERWGELDDLCDPFISPHLLSAQPLKLRQ